MDLRDVLFLLATAGKTELRRPRPTNQRVSVYKFLHYQEHLTSIFWHFFIKDTPEKWVLKSGARPRWWCAGQKIKKKCPYKKMSETGRSILFFPVPVLGKLCSSYWMPFFCLQFEASCLQLSFLLTVVLFSLSTYSCSMYAHNWSPFFTHSWNSFAWSGKVCLIRTSVDCQQRSSTVSKKNPTASKKTSPLPMRVASCSPVLDKNRAPMVQQF